MVKQLTESNVVFLEQGLAVLGGVPADAYTDGADGRSPVGAHVRHVIDHYRCFLDGTPAGQVDYDARARDPGLEGDPDRAVAAVRRIVSELRAVGAAGADSGVAVKMDCGDVAAEAAWCSSSVARELQFLAGHTVHHWAMIKVALASRGIPVPDDFGVAPATLAYRRGASECAR